MGGLAKFRTRSELESVGCPSLHNDYACIGPERTQLNRLAWLPHPQEPWVAEVNTAACRPVFSKFPGGASDLRKHASSMTQQVYLSERRHVLLRPPNSLSANTQCGSSAACACGVSDDHCFGPLGRLADGALGPPEAHRRHTPVPQRLLAPPPPMSWARRTDRAQLAQAAPVPARHVLVPPPRARLCARLRARSHFGSRPRTTQALCVSIALGAWGLGAHSQHSPLAPLERELKEPEAGVGTEGKPPGGGPLPAPDPRRIGSPRSSLFRGCRCGLRDCFSNREACCKWRRGHEARPALVLGTGLLRGDGGGRAQGCGLKRQCARGERRGR